MVKVPELPLFTGTPRRLCRHLTRRVRGRVQGKRIEHELYLPLKALHRTLQWLLERLAVWSRIITKFLDHHRSACGAKHIVFIPSRLQAWGEVVLLQKAYQAAHPQSYCQDHAANHEFEAPTPWRYSCPGGRLPWMQGLRTPSGFFGHADLLRESLPQACCPQNYTPFRDACNTPRRTTWQGRATILGYGQHLQARRSDSALTVGGNDYAARRLPLHDASGVQRYRR